MRHGQLRTSELFTCQGTCSENKPWHMYGRAELFLYRLNGRRLLCLTCDPDPFPVHKKKKFDCVVCGSQPFTNFDPYMQRRIDSNVAKSHPVPGTL